MKASIFFITLKINGNRKHKTKRVLLIRVSTCALASLTSHAWPLMLDNPMKRAKTTVKIRKGSFRLYGHIRKKNKEVPLLLKFCL